MDSDLWVFDIKSSADRSDDSGLKNFTSQHHIKKAALNKGILSGFGVDVKYDPISDIIVCWTPRAV